ncbi:protein NRT1/ PTR FAMILY 5.6 [Citrus sinensis]|uniref:Protein NRT1/ PTR FAMILY 5.6 n=1 Tax=Citrus sinensis TaxID=2711 RepID=A0ACB8I2Z6_CITSI|nr:protein NRT1/ PTR FAMILY 5.6 [Citrus sinensis]
MKASKFKTHKGLREKLGLELEPWSSRSAAGFSAADRWACSSSLRMAGRAAVSSRWLDAARRQQIVDAARRQQIVDAAVDGWTQHGSSMTTARQQQIADAAADGRTRNTAAADCGKERMFSCFLRVGSRQPDRVFGSDRVLSDPITTRSGLIENGKNWKIVKLLKLQNRFITWVRYYVCFCKAAAFLSGNFACGALGLLISRKLVDLAIVGVLITYFSDSEYSKVFTLQKAAIFTSVQDVILATLTIVAAWISCYAIRPLRILIFSTVSYILALGLLFCTASREFSETNFELLNMIGIILLAVGEVGAAPLLGPFLADQLREHGKGGRTENSNEDQVMAQKRVWWRFAWCCGAAAAFYANNIKTWKKTFMFTLLFMGGSLILLLLGIPFYHSRQIPPIDRFAIIRVIKTSLKKKHLNYPLSPELFFSNDEGNVLHLSPRIKLLRWIDKAAIIETSSTSNEQEEAGTLCTVAQVEVRRLEKLKQLENMSMFWLVPQFCLLGLMEGLAWYGCDEYSSSHFPERMEYHVSAISYFFVGIGSIFNIFFILANKGEFAETLDYSRIDKYYKSLTVISAVNVCYNFLLSILYIGSDQSVDNEGLQTNNTIGSDQIVDNEGLQTNDTTDADAI